MSTTSSTTPRPSPPAVAWATAGMLAVAAVALALRSPDAAVGPDAAQYLRAAEQLVAGGVLELPAPTPTGRAVFATWPPGYPALVALPLAAGLSAWWASKLVGAVSLLMAVPLLRRLAGDRIVPAVHTLGIASVLWLFVWSASEGPFLVASLALAAALASHERAPALRTAVAAALAATAMFYLRYIGAIGAIALLGAGAAQAARRRPGAGALLLAAGVSGALDAAWLARNLSLTGHLTGLPRLPAPEGVAALAVDLGRAGLAEAVFGARHLSAAPWVLAAALLSVAVQLGGLAWALRAPGWRRPAADPRWLWPAVLGVLYLGALVALRFSFHFDRFGWRLLAPGTSLLAVAAVVAVGGCGPQVRRRLDATLATSVLTGLVVALAAPAPDGLATASRALAATRARYADVPPACVVAPHDVALPWLRPDLVAVMPHHTPYDAEQESVQALTDRLLASPWPCIRLDVRLDLDPRRFDPSWAALAQEHPDGTLVLVR